jgi:ribosomal protein L35
VPKQKTHKASKRRMRLTVNGKLVRTKVNVRHLMTNRDAAHKRRARKKGVTTHQGQVRRARYAFRTGVA